MKSINSFTYFLIGTLSIFSLLVSSPLIGKEKHSKGGDSKRVLASFVADFPNQAVAALATVPFNIEESNQGDGITFGANNTFLVRKAGFYLVSYGVNAVPPKGSLLGGGINLHVTSNGTDAVISTIPLDSSQSIIIPLLKGDTVRLVTKEAITLQAGNLTTQLSDTAFITFLRVSCL
jgi:hypothetical protein